MNFRKNSVFMLTEISEGERVKVLGFDAGKCLKEKLIDQGLFPGVILKVLKIEKGGAALIMINGSRVMLGGGVLEKIKVRR